MAGRAKAAASRLMTDRIAVGQCPILINTGKGTFYVNQGLAKTRRSLAGHMENGHELANHTDAPATSALKAERALSCNERIRRMYCRPRRHCGVCFRESRAQRLVGQA